MNDEQDKLATRRVVAVVNDLLFGSRIGATARAAGVICATVRNATDMERALTAGPVDLVLVDLSLPEAVARDCLRLAAFRTPDAERVAFYSHVRQDLIHAAKEAGATKVLPHSRFVIELEHLIRGRQEGSETRRDRGS